jgi:hypothetical protein
MRLADSTLDDIEPCHHAVILMFEVMAVQKVLPEEELRSARDLVESSGLNYFTEPYIGDVAREIRESR